MFNKKNPGEAADPEDLPDGIYEILNDLKITLDYEGIGFVDEKIIYPRFFLIKYGCSGIRFLRVKLENIAWSSVPLYSITSGSFEISKGRIIKINN